MMLALATISLLQDKPNAFNVSLAGSVLLHMPKPAPCVWQGKQQTSQVPQRHVIFVKRALFKPMGPPPLAPCALQAVTVTKRGLRCAPLVLLETFSQKHIKHRVQHVCPAISPTLEQHTAAHAQTAPTQHQQPRHPALYARLAHPPPSTSPPLSPPLLHLLHQPPHLLQLQKPSRHPPRHWRQILPYHLLLLLLFHLRLCFFFWYRFGFGSCLVFTTPAAADCWVGGGSAWGRGG
mmetsp:Transcript_58439/g.94384  ORF Transcript_58439/g.94384 Transcript_58439/m.94384 type:complete len:235 (-) Transcript_58439:128-832(-)